MSINTIDNFLTNSKENYELAIMLGSTNYIKDLAATLALLNKILK